ncbi:hypothetical protein HDE_13077 [Halotydeus destructor]|nr:hypothetical protein HDE_13077 [Halotydeus destructor]
MASEIRSRTVYNSMIEQPTIRRKKRISSLIYAIVSIGFVGQGCNLLSLYLGYAVSYQTKFETPVNFSMPAVFTCVQSESKKNESMESRIKNAKSVSEMVKTCKVFFRNDTFVDCDHVSRYSKYFDSGYICFGLFERGHMKVQMDTVSHRSNQQLAEPLLKIAINTKPKVLTKLKFIVGPNNGQLVVVRNSDSIALCSSDVTFKMAVTFTRTFFSYLEAPYVSSCVDYQAVYGATRNEIINKCIISRSVPYPSRLITNEENSVDKLKRISTTVDKALLALMLYCGKKFNMTECTQSDYTLAVKSSVHNDDDTSTSVTFHLHRESVHDVVVRQFPEMDLFYLSINMGGVLSLWLGLSVFDLQAKLIDMICDRYDEKKFNENVFINLGKRKLIAKNRDHSNPFIFRLRVIITMIPLSGCVLHCYYDINSFIDNPFVTDSFIFKPQKVELPSVTICLKRTINWTRAPSYFNQLKEKGHPPEEFMLLRDFLNYSPKSSEVFLNESRFRQAKDLQPAAYRSKYGIRESVGRWRKCYTLFSDEKTDVTKTPAVYIADTLRLIDWAVVSMATQFAKEMLLVYHDGHNFESFLQDPSALYIIDSDINHYRLSYDSTMVKFMANHRKSICYDYRKLTSRTRMEMIRDCAITKYSETYPELVNNLMTQ